MPRSVPFVPFVPILLLAALLLPTSVGAGEGDGIQWEADVDAALARAAAEGRPLLLALNALETESANQQLATRIYPSAAWGRATEDWVCLPCNANGHGGEDCRRYPGIPCATHQAALRLLYRLRRLPSDQAVISPAHAVVGPDGRLLWTKEYYTGVVGPRLFEQMLSGISPSITLDRAARVRLDEIVALEETPTAKLEGAARAWLGRDDPLAAAAIIVAADQELDPPRRLALLRSLEAAGESAGALIQVGAYEAALFPAHDLDVCLVWLGAARAADADTALGHTMRALYRAEDDAQRQRIRSGGAAKPDRTKAARAAELELAWLLGQGKAGARPVDAGGDWIRRQKRARRQGLGKGRVYPTLEAVDDDAPPGILRGALLEATPAEVRSSEGKARRAFRSRREARVRIAAALALLAAGLDEGGRVPPTILDAVFDDVEGTDTRREAVSRLGGEDPGWDQAVWLEALTRAVGGTR